MTPLLIPCIPLPGVSSHALIIPATELEEHFRAAGALRQAEEACAVLQHQADEVLRQAQEEAEQIRQRAYQQGLLDAAQTLTSQHDALIEQTLQWHICKTQLQATLLPHLDGRIRALVAVALEEFVGEQHSAQLIVQRVHQRLERFLSEGIITLHVSEASEPLAQEHFGNHPHIRVVSSISLTQAQAQIQTAEFTLNIDLDRHLHSLLARLTQQPNEPAIDDLQDRSPEPETCLALSACNAASDVGSDADHSRSFSS